MASKSRRFRRSRSLTVMAASSRRSGSPAAGAGGAAPGMASETRRAAGGRSSGGASGSRAPRGASGSRQNRSKAASKTSKWSRRWIIVARSAARKAARSEGTWDSASAAPQGLRGADGQPGAAQHPPEGEEVRGRARLKSPPRAPPPPGGPARRRGGGRCRPGISAARRASPRPRRARARAASRAVRARAQSMRLGDAGRLEQASPPRRPWTKATTCAERPAGTSGARRARIARSRAASG